jgi:predicted metalloendopeptidase
MRKYVWQFSARGVSLEKAMAASALPQSTAEIPADQTSWASFVEIRERNAAVMRQILEKAAAESAGRDAIAQKIGDYYGSCMDSARAEA